MHAVLALALAGTAAAIRLPENLRHVVARDDGDDDTSSGSQWDSYSVDLSCYTAYSSIVNGEPTAPADLTEYFATMTADFCSFTLPASLENEYSSYVDAFNTWYDDNIDQLYTYASECGYGIIDTSSYSNAYSDLYPLCDATATAGGSSAPASATATTTDESTAATTDATTGSAKTAAKTTDATTATTTGSSTSKSASTATTGTTGTATSATTATAATSTGGAARDTIMAGVALGAVALAVLAL